MLQIRIKTWKELPTSLWEGGIKARKELLTVWEFHNSHTEVLGAPSFSESYDILGTEELTTPFR